MIYRLQVGRMSRKQNLEVFVDKVVSFNGTQSELHNIMTKKYEGFSLNIHEVKNVDVVLSDKKDSKESVVVSKSGQYGDHYLNKASFPYDKFIGDDILKEWRAANRIHHEAEQKFTSAIRSELSKREYVESVESIKTFQNTFECRIKISGSLIKIVEQT